MKWFGKHYGAPYEDDTPHVETPTGEPCAWCTEPIAANESGVILPLMGRPGKSEIAYHFECRVRTIMGGVNHQLHLCCCRGCAGVLAPDPAGMTRREAAMAASKLFAESGPF